MLLRIIFCLAVYVVGKHSSADGMSIANHTDPSSSEDPHHLGIYEMASSTDLQTVNSSAICPDDSVSVDDVCKCNHERCAKPQCDAVLILVKNHSHVPGLCCPKYICGECAPENLINSRCMCAPDAFLNEEGDCECSDPHKSLKNDTCVCDINKCELPTLCDEHSVSIPEGCCPKVKCVTCPADSYPTSYNSYEIEDKCVCFPCPITKCNEPLTLNIIRRGRSIPDTCCDIYTCENSTVVAEKTCHVNHTSYIHGDSWNTPEGHKCTCQNGVSLCKNVISPKTPVACLSGDKVYPHESTWIEDTCTNCTCDDGKPVCIAYRCDIDVSEMKITPSCPSLQNCDKTCEYGFKINKKGCEMCKCNELSSRRRYKLLEMFIKHYNLSENETLTLLQEHVFNKEKSVDLNSTGVSSSTAPTTTTSTTNSVMTTPTTITAECLNTGHLPYILHGVFFVLGILVCYLLVHIRTCFKSSSYDYAPVKKATDNNNISDIYSQRSTELSTIKLKRDSILT